MNYTYTKEYNTSYSYIDCTGCLGLVEFMNLNQDMITEFCGLIGSDNATLRQKNNAAWIYTGTKVVRVDELPFWNTKTKAVTFVCSRSPIRIELETDLYDENDKLLIAAKTEMCAIDLGTRKIRKIDSLEFPSDLEVVKTNMDGTFSKINTEFDDADKVYMQEVYAGDTDFTRHTNNVRYVSFIMNTFDSFFYDEMTIRCFEIRFAKESKEKDNLAVYKKKNADGGYDFVIKKEDEVVVKARMSF